MSGFITENKNKVIIFILFLCWVVGFIDKTAINIAIIPISGEFGLASDETGMIISGFFLAYSITQLIGGYLVDRLGSKTILTGAVGLWSVATACTGMATGILGLVVSRFFVGMGEAVFPSGSSVVIAQQFDKSKMARAKSFLQSGASVGFAVGSVVVTTLIAFFNWRVMFFVLGILGMGLALVLWLVLRSSADHQTASPAASTARDKTSEKRRLLEIVTRPLTWQIAACYFFTNIVFWGLQSWLPSYWIKVKGMSMVSMGAWSMLPPTLGFISFLVCGWLLDRFFQGREKFLIAIGSSVSALFIWLMFNASSVPIAFAWLSLSNIFLNAISISVFVTIIKQYPKASVGTATGLINSVAQIGSFLSPLVIGYLLKLTNQNYSTAFLMIIACAVVTCLIALSMTHSNSTVQSETRSNPSH
ncbi:MFS transporter [Pantoea cypripedii]|uniref:MFS transporter n=1 Tax=Pantoea cypripedii TaxID=55209 RepID=A0A1X1EL69_PANCY|nr:MFS transporter [Pantoea cypripedii]MBP2200064.1 sugar phosphate permease [Pantoea cypripedii]ORM89671.1 MFS transporter [Pantoea cypripedii]